MLVKKRRLLLAAAFLIVAAVAVVLFVTFLTGGKVDEFEGTLVKTAMPVWYI